MRSSKFFLGIAVAAYVVSLVLPTVNDGQGLIFAVWGFVAFAMARVWAVVWLANPAFIASGWLLHKHRAPRARRLLAVAALAFALFAMTIDATDGVHGGVELQTGYWVWLASILVMVVAVLMPTADRAPRHDSAVVAEPAM